jgi:hypothetical protein
MLKKFFENRYEKPKKMTQEEALDVLDNDKEFKRFYRAYKFSKAEVQTLTGDETEDIANSLLAAENEVQKFNDAKVIVGILKAMQLEIQKLVDPLDKERVERNKKVSEALTTLARNERLTHSPFATAQ